jgi:hypothetical protein
MEAALSEERLAWVRAGGHLGTTDWALKHFLEGAVPGSEPPRAP